MARHSTNWRGWCGIASEAGFENGVQEVCQRTFVLGRLRRIRSDNPNVTRRSPAATVRYCRPPTRYVIGAALIEPVSKDQSSTPVLASNAKSFVRSDLGQRIQR